MEDSNRLLDQYARLRDAEAFAQLVQTYQGLVMGVCRRTLHDASLAEDAAQEVFISLARAAGSVRGNVAAWLHSCAVNACHTLNRRRRSERTRLSQLASTRPDATHGEVPEWEQLQCVLDESLADLPSADRELIIERFMVGRSQQEIADSAGVSQSLISRRIARSVERLRALMRRRGVVVPAVLLLTVLAKESQAAVPPMLFAKLSGIGLAGIGPGGPQAVSMVSFLGGVVAMKKSVAAGLAVLLLVLMGVGGWMVWQLKQGATPVATSPKGPDDRPATTPSTSAIGIETRPPAQPEAIVHPEAVGPHLAKLGTLVYDVSGIDEYGVVRLTSSPDAAGRQVLTDAYEIRVQRDQPLTLRQRQETTLRPDEPLAPLVIGFSHELVELNRKRDLMIDFSGGTQDMTYDKLMSIDVLSGQKNWRIQPLTNGAIETAVLRLAGLLPRTPNWSANVAMLESDFKLNRLAEIHFAGRSTVDWCGRRREVRVYQIAADATRTMTVFIDASGRPLVAESRGVWTLRPNIIVKLFLSEDGNEIGSPVVVAREDEWATVRLHDGRQIQISVRFAATPDADGDVVLSLKTPDGTQRVETKIGLRDWESDRQRVPAWATDELSIQIGVE